MTTFRNDDVSVTLRGFNELHMHRTHCGDVLFNDRFYRAASLCDVAAQPANETNVVRRIDKHPNIQLLKQARIGKDQYAFHYHNRLGFDRASFVQATMCLEIVDWQFNRLARFQPANVLDEQIVIERVGMIEVSDLPIVERQIREVAIIRVLLNEDYFARLDRFQNAVRYCCLTRSGAT